MGRKGKKHAASKLSQSSASAAQQSILGASPSEYEEVMTKCCPAQLHVEFKALPISAQESMLDALRAFCRFQCVT